MLVRDAGQDDMDAVARIKVANWSETYAKLVPEETLTRFLDLGAQREYLTHELSGDDNLLLVAEDHGKVVGFALAFLDERPDPWLESLHVTREARGKGTGTLLVREVARRAATRGCATLRLGVVAGNDSAGRLYRRLGAQVIGEEPAHWAPGVAHELYRWASLAPLIE